MGVYLLYAIIDIEEKEQMIIKKDFFFLIEVTVSMVNQMNVHIIMFSENL